MIMNLENGLSLALGRFQPRIRERLKQLQEENFVQRLWNKEDNFWKRNETGSEEESCSMGWLDVVDKMLYAMPIVDDFCLEIKNEGFTDVVLLGMGGSSLTPLVFQRSMPVIEGGLRLKVLDTTEPEMIRKVEHEIDIDKTLFIVSSKSGTTAEIKALYEYFYYRVAQVRKERPGRNFIAITDDDTPLVALAEQKEFRRIFINYPGIGGRFSALSFFGMLPAALMGINVTELLERSRSMVYACGIETPIEQNPGIVLGVVLAELAYAGIDKLTYLMPPELNTFGLWLEQLLAESTGKNGKGILPVNGNPLMEYNYYGKDRVFLHMGITGEYNDINRKLEHFQNVEFPVISLQINDELDLGKEFFKWEIATATACALLKVNPFDQPKVRESKKFTERLLKKIEQDGIIPEAKPVLIENSVQYFYNQHADSAVQLMEKFMSSYRPGDYITLQAYIPEEHRVNCIFRDMQVSIQKKFQLAVSTQFGPRYLHSTGQYHKGGPNNGIYIQFVCSSSDEIRIPGCAYTFGQLKRAQALGDREALMKYKRRVILVDLGHDYVHSLDTFKKVMEELRMTRKENRSNQYVSHNRRSEIPQVILPVSLPQFPSPSATA